MRRLLRPTLLCTPVALLATTSGYATTYLTIEQAQAVMCPGEQLEPVTITLTDVERRAIEHAASVRVRQPTLRAWRIASGGWFLVDDVLGKHEYITYAVRLAAGGAVQQVEILTYRETYGGQIRDAAWRAQFTGRTSRSPLRLDQDIRNISGATLSCRNVTDGIKRLLATHDLVLAHH
jgi:hypothetical protein